MFNNIKSQMRKGLLEYCILSIISQHEAYSSDILDTLKKANLVVVEGTVYPLLTRMKNEGYFPIVGKSPLVVLHASTTH
jgi:PadR family transcriptional regulator PadR